MTGRQVFSDYEFTLPGVSNVQFTVGRLTAKVHLPEDTVTGLLIMFMGGYNYEGTYFQGNIRQTSRIY